MHTSKLYKFDTISDNRIDFVQIQKHNKLFQQLYNKDSEMLLIFSVQKKVGNLFTLFTVGGRVTH